MMMNKLIKNKLGLTLIEVVVALGVVTTGVLSGLTLTTYNLNTAESSATRLIASNLAREGIEVIRQKRDSNWLASAPWNEGIVEVGEHRLTVNFDEALNQWLTVTQVVDMDGCAECQIYLNPATGVYSHEEIGTLPTAYQRWLGLKEICWQEEVGSEAILAAGQQCEDVNQPLVGYEVESLVTWRESNRAHSLSVIDRLYDWR